MTIGAAVTPGQLDAGATTAAGASAPGADLFGGIISALAVAGAEPKPVAAGALLPEEGQPTPCKLELMDEPAEAASAADQLLALSAALPAQAQILVRKPAPAEPSSTDEGDEPADGDTDGAEKVEQLVAPLLLGQAPPTPTTVTAKAERPLATSSQRLQPAPEPKADPQITAPQGRFNKATAEADTPPAPELARLLQQHKPEPVREAMRALLAQLAPATAASKVAREGAEPAPLAPELKPATSLFTPIPFAAPEIAPRIDAPAPTEAPVEMDTAELVIEQQLDLASDGEWLDDLARDIARTAGGEGKLNFRLNPEHLGSLKVELTPDRGGTAVRLTADTEAARAIIAEAQPRLLAEARAQGLRISEAHVDLGQPGGDPRRNAEAYEEPQLRTARSVQDEAPSDEKPTGGTSDLYA
jgi:flagellar hook-length control protein FliK